MRKLPQDHPEIYEKFMQGHFVVKQNNRGFNAVAPDMKLEQTIQGSKKSVKRIIGQTRQVAYVSPWEMCTMKFLPQGTVIHHELGSGPLSKWTFELLCEKDLRFYCS